MFWLLTITGGIIYSLFYKFIMFHIYKFIKFEIRACAQNSSLKYWCTSQQDLVEYFASKCRLTPALRLLHITGKV